MENSWDQFDSFIRNQFEDNGDAKVNIGIHTTLLEGMKIKSFYFISSLLTFFGVQCFETYLCWSLDHV